MIDQQPKEKDVQYITGYNSPEQAKVGEISLSSEVLTANALLDLIVAALKDETVASYLETLKKKQISGRYIE